MPLLLFYKDILLSENIIFVYSHQLTHMPLLMIINDEGILLSYPTYTQPYS